MSESRALFRQLLRREWVDHPFSIDEWLIDAAVAALGKSEDLAEAYAETNKKRIWNAFLRMNDEGIAVGREPAFEPVDVTSRLIRLRTPAPFGARARKQKLVWAVLRWLDDLDSRQFEYCGALTAQLIGSTKTYVTPRGNEGGVDFYALVPVGGPSDVFHGPRRELRVVGQSKKYATPAGVEKVRDFSDVLDSIRKRARIMELKTPRWFQDHPGPIVGWIAASSGYQETFGTLCRERGIMASDDRGLAINIINSRAFPLGLSASDVANYLNARLQNVVDQNDANA